VISRSTELFYAGKTAALAGDFSCAEQEFDRALDLVIPTSGPRPEGRDVEEFRVSLYESILRYEALSQAGQDADASEERETPDELVGVSGRTSDADLARARDEVSSDERAQTFDIPITINDPVLSMVAAFSSKDSVRRRFEEGLVNSGRYMPMIRDAFARAGLPKDLAYVAMIESSFKPKADSRARAHGIWQFISSTGRRYGLKQSHLVDERSDPVKATEAAGAYLKDLYDIFDDWYLAMAAYDSGPGRVARAIERTGSDDYWELCRAGALPRETRLYVPSVLAAAIIAKNPEHYGFHVEPDPPLDFETVRLSRPVSLRSVAAASGVGFEQLASLNPELRQGITPKESDGYDLRVPAGARTAVLERLSEVPTARIPTVRRYRIRRGDTLSAIARRYGVSIDSLARANHISRRTPLRIGALLVVPTREPERRASTRSRSHHRRTASRARTARYRVRRGDTLSSIAARHHVDVGDLCRWNGLDDDDPIHPGDHLQILRSRR
jgi:membrane-bound lytic murein transglycosylase D